MIPKYIRKHINYYFEDDNKAYTEDDILIYNIFVHKIPKTISKETLVKYFEKFGEVEKVECSKIGTSKNASVYFKDAWAAARVLENYKHFLEHKKVFVKACESWQQPRKRLTNTANRAAKVSIGYFHILQLNDDCLETICQKLDLKNQIGFARVCQRFKYIFEMHCKLKYKEMKLYKLSKLTLWECRDFFEFVGHYIEKIDYSQYREEDKRVINYFGNCTNVKCIKMSSSTIPSHTWGSTLKNMSTITELELSYSTLKDAAMKSLNKLPNLEILSLESLKYISGKYLKDIKNLKELTISRCPNVTEANFIEKTSLHKLRSLCLLHMHPTAFPSRAINELLKNCINLEELETDVLIAEGLPFLPKLKKLIIKTDQHYHQLITKLAEHQAGQLEHLTINYLTCEEAEMMIIFKKLKHLRCMSIPQLNDYHLYAFAELENLEQLLLYEGGNISEQGLLHLLRKSLKLKMIDIIMAKRITNNFVYEAIKLLKQISHQRIYSKPLSIRTGACQVNPDIVEDPIYIAAKPYIRMLAWNEVF